MTSRQKTAKKSAFNSLIKGDDIDRTYRNWTTYNTALRNKISELRAEGIEIYLAEVDANVKALIDQLSFQEDITDDGGHYRGIGNLMVAKE